MLRLCLPNRTTQGRLQRGLSLKNDPCWRGRHSVKQESMQAAVGHRGVELMGLKVVSLTPEQVLPDRYIVDDKHPVGRL